VANGTTPTLTASGMDKSSNNLGFRSGHDEIQMISARAQTARRIRVAVTMARHPSCCQASALPGRHME
jgi:hypothetical protein